MSNSNRTRFDASRLSDVYKRKSSLARYRELTHVFPHTLILFHHQGYYYGFDESAVVLNIWFGYPLRKAKGMLVVKDKNLDPIIRKCQLRGIRYVLDRNGELTFGAGKGFRLKKPPAYYEEHPVSRPAPKVRVSSYSDSCFRSGGGWQDDVWTPGLPSARMFKKR